MAQILVQGPVNRPSSNRWSGTPTSRGTKGLVWRLYLGVGALAVVVYFLLPPLAGAALNLVVGASASVAILVGLRWHRPLRRSPWRPGWPPPRAGARPAFKLLIANLAVTMVGDTLFSVLSLSGAATPGGRFQLEAHPGAGVVLRASFGLPSTA